MIAGPDANGYRADVEGLAAKEGIADRVIFPGMLVGREKIETIVDADLFVFQVIRRISGSSWPSRWRPGRR